MFEKSVRWTAGAVAVIVGIAIVAGVGYFAYPRLSDDTPAWRADAVDTDKTSRRLDALESQLDRLVRQVDRLATRLPPTDAGRDTGVREELAELTAEVERLSAAQTVSRMEQNPEEPTRPDVIGQEQQQAAERARNYRELLNSTLAQEPVDEAWSSSVTWHLEQTLMSPELAAGSLASADCRSTMCRVEILHDSSVSPQELSMFENELLTRLGPELGGGTVRRVQGPDGLRTIAFIARKGHDLPYLSDSDTGASLQGQ